MIPRQPAQRIPKLLAACDVAFLSFQDNELWSKTIPAKLQSYMACGMPIIAAARGETIRIINESKCGIGCKNGDSNELAKAIHKIQGEDLKTMGQNARLYFEKNFDKQMLMEQMEGYIERGKDEREEYKKDCQRISNMYTLRNGHN
jgi:glycosyltransferase involved in cell wall biosynthesis